MRGRRSFGAQTHCSEAWSKSRFCCNLFHAGAGHFTWSDFRISVGRNHPIVSTSSKIGRLAGNHHDIVCVYGIRSDSSVSAISETIFNGRGHELRALGADIGVICGRNNDLYVRFCFDGARWETGLGGRNGLLPTSSALPPARPICSGCPGRIVNSDRHCFRECQETCNPQTGHISRQSCTTVACDQTPRKFILLYFAKATIATVLVNRISAKSLVSRLRFKIDQTH